MTPILSRRHFLRSALAAPAIVAVSSIMPVKLFSLEPALKLMTLDEYMRRVFTSHEAVEALRRSVWDAFLYGIGGHEVTADGIRHVPAHKLLEMEVSTR